MSVEDARAKVCAAGADRPPLQRLLPSDVCGGVEPGPVAETTPASDQDPVFHDSPLGDSMNRHPSEY